MPDFLLERKENKQCVRYISVSARWIQTKERIYPVCHPFPPRGDGDSVGTRNDFSASKCSPSFYSRVNEGRCINGCPWCLMECWGSPTTISNVYYTYNQLPIFAVQTPVTLQNAVGIWQMFSDHQRTSDVLRSFSTTLFHEQVCSACPYLYQD